jgi:hypothetical protein
MFQTHATELTRAFLREDALLNQKDYLTTLKPEKMSVKQ